MQRDFLYSSVSERKYIGALIQIIVVLFRYIVIRYYLYAVEHIKIFG